MRKHLLKTDGRGRGLYLNSDPSVGTWKTWEALPMPDTTDPALKLLAEQTPKVAAIGGLYGDPNAHRETERRRKADAVLEKFGVKPRRW